ITTGLVASYPFSSNANDASGNGNNGTVNGATLTTDRFGNVNSAYSFNGTSDYIQSISAPLTSPPFSISAWVNLSNFSGLNPILTFGAGGTNLNTLYFGTNPNGYLQIGTSGANDITSTDALVTASNWQHVVVVCNSYDVSQVNFYIDGIQYSTNTTGGTNVPVPFNNTYFEIGKGTGYLSGKIDDLKIYNRALTSCDIDSLYNFPNNTGVDDISFEPKLNIYPNPTNGPFVVSCSKFESQNEVIEIYNVIGEKVYSSALVKKQQIINCNLKAGIYFVRVNSGENNLVQKLIAK
ncbi:MAG: LamG-like jellyroll fold domain-containing protein, partial [Bacteroidota bacterium]